MKEVRETDLIPEGQSVPSTFHQEFLYKTFHPARMQAKPEEVWQECVCLGLDTSLTSLSDLQTSQC